jgi:hypothetical protein
MPLDIIDTKTNKIHVLEEDLTIEDVLKALESCKKEKERRHQKHLRRYVKKVKEPKPPKIPKKRGRPRKIPLETPAGVV